MDGRTTEHGYTISSPCEPDGSGELKKAINIASSSDHDQACGLVLGLNSLPSYQHFLIH